MEEFDCLKAQCREEADRVFVMKSIQSWYGDPDAFNRYVRSDLKSKVQQIVRSKGIARVSWQCAFWCTFPVFCSHLDMVCGNIKSGNTFNNVLAHFVGANLALASFALPMHTNLFFYFSEICPASKAQDCGESCLDKLAGVGLGFAITIIGVLIVIISIAIFTVGGTPGSFILLVLYGLMAFFIFRKGSTKSMEDTAEASREKVNEPEAAQVGLSSEKLQGA